MKINYHWCAICTSFLYNNVDYLMSSCALVIHLLMLADKYFYVFIIQVSSSSLKYPFFLSFKTFRKEKMAYKYYIFWHILESKRKILLQVCRNQYQCNSFSKVDCHGQYGTISAYLKIRTNITYTNNFSFNTIVSQSTFLIAELLEDERFFLLSKSREQIIF